MFLSNSRLQVHIHINLGIKRAAQDLLSQRQILGTGNLPQDSAPVCINIDISPEMAAQSVQQTKHFVSPHLIGPQFLANQHETNQHKSCNLWRVTEIIGNRRREEYRGTSPPCSGEYTISGYICTTVTVLLELQETIMYVQNIYHN